MLGRYGVGGWIARCVCGGVVIKRSREGIIHQPERVVQVYWDVGRGGGIKAENVDEEIDGGLAEECAPSASAALSDVSHRRADPPPARDERYGAREALEVSSFAHDHESEGSGRRSAPPRRPPPDVHIRESQNAGLCAGRQAGRQAGRRACVPHKYESMRIFAHTLVQVCIHA